jgi:ribonucleoside-diphosphate reductase alpha chain
MFRRVAEHVASAEALLDPAARREDASEAYYAAMKSLEFLPNSPTLMNAGRQLGQLAACFVLPVEDSLESIFNAVRDTALIHQSGGGTGFSFSRLRPANDLVSTTSGVASGAVSFMQVFNKATEVIKQGGTRRGANMGVLRVDHPDIEAFITAKRTPHELTSFNLSVALTGEFMKALKKGGDYDLTNPRTGLRAHTERAEKIFDLIVECAWESGEPGVLFLDHLNDANPTPQLGEIESTNPCGEQPLLPFEACNLGSINLVKMVRNVGGSYEVDWEKLRYTVHVAVRFLDDVIEVNRYPLPAIERISRANRKIGLGVMGFAHFLILLGIAYTSEDAIHTAEDVMAFIQQEGRLASQELAGRRGAFPNFHKSRYQRDGVSELRNATVTTIAPTGTLSIIAGCSSGIEPLYALCYTRRILEDRTFTETDPLFRQKAQDHGIWTPELARYVCDTGSLPEEVEIDPKVRRLFVTAFDVPPAHHVRIQAAFQSHTDNAVSKTINFPHDATKSDVRDALLMAYRLGCKGVTIYRSGTREGQVLTCGPGVTC